MRVYTQVRKQPGFEDNTPLHVAASKNLPLCIKALLKAGADKDNFNRQGMQPMHTAAFSGSVESLKALIGSRADVESRCRPGCEASGKTALDIAKKYKNTLCVELLEASRD